MIGRGRGRLAWAAAALIALGPVPARARDVLGVFEQWGAFRDPDQGRCYAIAEPVDDADDKGSATAKWRPFAAIGYWPRQNVRGQVNVRLSHAPAPGTVATLSIGARHFALTGGGADVWARNRQDDAAIVAAIRSGGVMYIHGHAGDGTTFSDHYVLRGAATAIDAAALGCARIK